VSRRLRLYAIALGLAAGLGGSGAADQDEVLTLHEAQLMASVGGRAQPERSINLPLHWDVLYEGRSGRAELTLAFDLPHGAEAAREPHALFIARLGNAYEIELNGVLLLSAGSLEDSRDRWSAKHPVWLTFPSRLLEAHNALRIRLRADGGYRAGLSPVVVGPARLVAPASQRAEQLRVTLPQATAVFSFLVACFCGLLWWQQRDVLYAWAACGEALWAVTVADAVIEHAPLPWPTWGLSLLLVRAAWAWSLYAIAESVFGRRPRGEHWAMFSVQASAPLCVVLMVATGSTRPLMAWYAANFLAWGWVIARLFVQTLRHASSERVIVIVAVIAVVLASLRDVVAARLQTGLYDESAWAKYLASLVGMALMWIVSQRFLKARSEALLLSASLSRQVEHKERELRASFERLSSLERSRAVLAERERILRDMHDGVGSHLATAMRQLEGGRARAEEVVETLRDSMDHLKLSIDAMTLPAGDVNALLGSLRYRLQPRLESAGIKVEWNVDALPLWPGGRDEAMHHVQFLLLEVVSNVLQHACASTLGLSASAGSGCIVVTLTDDGLGMDITARQRLRSMQARARAVGAILEIEPMTPGTRVTITLPAADLAPARDGAPIA